MTAILVFAFATWFVPAVLWWTIGRLTGFGRAPRYGPRRRTKAHSDGLPRVDTADVREAAARLGSDGHPGIAWADPGQVWPALTIENALLTALLSRRITAADYRHHMADLARRCEPAHPTAGDD